MKLKEFDLDLPRLDRESRKNFRWQTRCVAALYSRCFPGLDVSGAWKVLVACVDRVDVSGVQDQLGVFTQEVELDYPAFLGAAPLHRKELATEVLHKGALRVAQAQGWSSSPFEAAYRQVVELHYVNEWTWPKPRSSPNRKRRAFLSCLHEAEYFRAWLVVVDKDGTDIERVLAIDEPPNEFIFVPKMGEVKWTSDEHVVLLDKSGSEVAGLTIERPT
jgi:hypothetical protein